MFSEKYYPGWGALVDGSQAEVLRYSGIFQGVKIDAGKHNVILKYSPPYLKIFIGIQVLTYLLIAYAVFNDIARTKKTG